MDYFRLPNGLRVAHIHAGETGMLYRRIFVDRCYLRYGITLSPGNVIFDVGANIGMASLFFSQYCSEITVYGFEPAEIPFSALSENMSMHGIQGVCQQVALSAAPGTRQFTYYPRATVMSGMYADDKEDSALTRQFLRNSGFNEGQADRLLASKYEPQTSFTNVTTLSQEIRSHGIGTIDLLKLDVEKSEFQVLLGLEDYDWPKVKQVVAEVHDIDGRLAEFVNLLRTHDFDTTAEQDKLLEDTEIYSVFAIRLEQGR